MARFAQAVHGTGFGRLLDLRHVKQLGIACRTSSLFPQRLHGGDVGDVSRVFWVLLFMMAIRKSSDAMGQPLVSQIRWIAQEPLPERHDPRFKEWKDVRTRFPAVPNE
jgi:hypothetical protein